MAVTTQQQELVRLRSYLNPFFQGPNISAVLWALASGSGYLVNSASATNDQLYISTAAGQYLDQLLTAYGITRPPALGLSDDIFRQIGIEIKNRKQVRDLINQLLDLIFGDQLTKAYDSATTFEPYNLADQDTLIVNFDSKNTTTIIFSEINFNNIAAATAQEVADAITVYLSNLNLPGTAIVQNDGNGNYVQLLSQTIGAASSVTVLGGSAQNVLLFPSPLNTTANMSTQWTLSLRSGGVIRYTWSGGANPNLGLVNSGDYVNIFGGGFASSPNSGSFIIIDSHGGAVNNSYFEISNYFGTSGIITQGADNAVLFFNPIKRTITSNTLYAAQYSVQNATLQVFLPVSTQLINRTRMGGAFVPYPPNGNFVFKAQPIDGDMFAITSTATLVAGVNFAIGGTLTETLDNLSAAINMIIGIESVVDYENNIVNIQNMLLANTLTIIYTGAQNIIASGPLGNKTVLMPNEYGPYGYDFAYPFVVSATSTTLEQELDSTKSRVISVENSSAFPNSQGYIVFEYGSENQEGPVPYIATPDSTTLLVSPAYTIQKTHAAGTSVFLVASNAPVVITQNGTDYPFYVTDTAPGWEYAEQLINSVTAAGINVVITVLYPGDIFLGKWGTSFSEIVEIWS